MSAELQSIENYYLARLQSEKEQKERAQELARALAKQLEKKNQEIEKLNFHLHVALRTLKLAVNQVNKLRKVPNE